ncbi:hypothetical protein GCM10020254_26510 [Streptomyces goshikiensis]
MSTPARRALPALSLALALLALSGPVAAAAASAAGGAAPAVPPTATPALRLAGAGECTYPMKKQIADRPWALQRLLLDALWAESKGKDAKGASVRVAVIDTGVDRANPQLSGAVDTGAGKDYVDPKGGDGTNDTVGHGTKVAGLIAARPPRTAPDSSAWPPRPRSSRSGRTTGRARATPRPWARRSTTRCPRAPRSSTSPRTPTYR